MSEVMTFQDYQLQAAETAIYPGAGSGSITAIAYLGLGLGEAGEVQGKIKKILRDNNGGLTSDTVDSVVDELGDLTWYVANLASELGVGLEDVAERNLQKLKGRKSRGVLGGSGDNR